MRERARDGGTVRAMRWLNESSYFNVTQHSFEHTGEHLWVRRRRQRRRRFRAFGVARSPGEDVSERAVAETIARIGGAGAARRVREWIVIEILETGGAG